MALTLCFFSYEAKTDLSKYAGKEETKEAPATVAPVTSAPPAAATTAPAPVVEENSKKDVYVTLRRTAANKNTRVTIRGGNLQADLFSEEGLTGEQVVSVCDDVFRLLCGCVVCCANLVPTTINQKPLINREVLLPTMGA